MLMHAHDGGVRYRVFIIGIGSSDSKKTLPDLRFASTDKPGVHEIAKMPEVGHTFTSRLRAFAVGSGYAAHS